MIAARRRIYRDFLRYCRPTPTDAILDVGVSDVVSDGANVLEQQYPYPDRITGTGLGQGRAFRSAFPKACYRQIEPNHPLLFADRAFAIATSNANMFACIADGGGSG